MQSQVKFDAVRRKFRKRFRRKFGRLWCSQVRFDRVPEVPGESLGRCRSRSGSKGFWRRFRRKFQEALVHSEVKFSGFRRRLQKSSRFRFIELTDT